MLQTGGDRDDSPVARRLAASDGAGEAPEGGEVRLFGGVPASGLCKDEIFGGGFQRYP